MSWLIGLSAWLLASTALAQTGDLWEQGVALRAEGQDAGALQAFQRDYARGGTLAALAQVALAEQALGQWGPAHRHLSLAMSGSDAWVAQNRSALDQAMGEIQRHTGLLEVTVDHAGAQISIGGEEVGRSPLLPVHVSAGAVPIRVSRNGVVVDRMVTVAVGQTAREAVVLGAAASGDTGGGGDTLTIVGVVMLGLAAGAVAGVVAGWVLREDAALRYNDPACLPPVGSTRDQMCGDLRTESDTMTGVAIGSAIGAAVFAGVGMALLSVGGGDSDSASLECAPGLASLHCSGRF